MILRIISLCLATFLAAGMSWSADEEKERPRRGGPGFGHGERGGPERWFESLSDEEKERIRSAISAVWSDPEVVKARNKMAAASEELKVALRAAVEREDPEVREILKGMVTRGGGEKGVPGFGTPGMRGRPLNPEERKILDEARGKALESEAVNAAREEREMAKTMQQKFEASRKFQEAIYKEMVKIDPQVEKILAKRVRSGGIRPSGGRPGGAGGDGSRGPGKRSQDGKKEGGKKEE